MRGGGQRRRRLNNDHLYRSINVLIIEAGLYLLLLIRSSALAFISPVRTNIELTLFSLAIAMPTYNLLYVIIWGPLNVVRNRSDALGRLSGIIGAFVMPYIIVTSKPLLYAVLIAFTLMAVIMIIGAIAGVLIGVEGKGRSLEELSTYR